MTDDAELPQMHDGVYWWKLQSWPGTKQRFGGEPKLAAFLYFNVEVSDSFTMRQLREALGEEDTPDAAEHLNRRLRNLRKQGWRFRSYKDQAGQAVDTYVLLEKGNRLWLREYTRSPAISAAVGRAPWGGVSRASVSA
ncbi:hypothetical protein [Mycolicibacter sinensis]